MDICDYEGGAPGTAKGWQTYGRPSFSTSSSSASYPYPPSPSSASLGIYMFMFTFLCLKEGRYQYGGYMRCW